MKKEKEREREREVCVCLCCSAFLMPPIDPLRERKSETMRSIDGEREREETEEQRREEERGAGFISSSSK